MKTAAPADKSNAVAGSGTGAVGIGPPLPGPEPTGVGLDVAPVDPPPVVLAGAPKAPKGRLATAMMGECSPEAGNASPRGLAPVSPPGNAKDRSRASTIGIAGVSYRGANSGACGSSIPGGISGAFKAVSVGCGPAATGSCGVSESRFPHRVRARFLPSLRTLSFFGIRRLLAVQ